MVSIGIKFGTHWRWSLNDLINFVGIGVLSTCCCTSFRVTWWRDCFEYHKSLDDSDSNRRHDQSNQSFHVHKNPSIYFQKTIPFRVMIFREQKIFAEKYYFILNCCDSSYCRITFGDIIKIFFLTLRFKNYFNHQHISVLISYPPKLIERKVKNRLFECGCFERVCRIKRSCV